MNSTRPGFRTRASIPVGLSVFYLCTHSLSLAAQTLPIDLPTALRLADERNLDIASYLEKIGEASARLDQSRYLAIPTLRLGAGRNEHSGPLQQSSGEVIEVDRDSRQTGFGVGAVGAGDPIVPGLSVDVHIAEAVFMPLVAKQDRKAALAASDANRQQVLLDVTAAYLHLVQSHAEQAITSEALQRAEDLAGVTASFADAGEGLRTDAAMASVQTYVWQRRLEATLVAAEMRSVALVRLLHLDGDTRLEPLDRTVPILNIDEIDDDIGVLVDRALNNRPEAEQHQAMLEAARQGIKQEAYGPLIPRVSLSYSDSDFGGSGSGFADYSGRRDDLSVMLYWQLDNLGFGRRARLDEKQANIRRLEIQRDKLLDDIVAEVRAAQLQIQSLRRQLDLSEQAIRVAGDAYELVRERVYERQGLPLEALQSMQALADAQMMHLQALIDYNLAQIQLHVALGNPVSDSFWNSVVED